MGNLCGTDPDKEAKSPRKRSANPTSPPPSAPREGYECSSTSSPCPDATSAKGVKQRQALHTGNCAALALLSDKPTQVLSGGEDHCLDLTDWAADKVIFRLTDAHSKDINRVVYCQQRQLAITASRDKDVKVFSLENSGSLVHTCSAHTFNVSALTVNPEETIIFTGARDNHVRLWDLETGQPITFNRTARNLVQNAKWIPGSSLVVQSSEDLYLRFWDTRDSLLKCAFNFSALEYHAPGLDCSEDGLYVLTGHNGFAGEGSWAKLWDVRMQQLIRTFSGHQYTISNALFLGPNRRAGHDLVITASNDCTVKLWDVNSGECVQTNYFNAGRISSMAVVNKSATKENSAPDVFLGFFSGMMAAYTLTNTLELRPLIEYGEPGAAMSPDAESEP